MAHTTDMIAAFAAARGNLALGSPAEIPLADFESVFGVGFTPDSTQPSTLRFLHHPEGDGLVLSDWYPRLAERGAKGLILVDLEWAGRTRARPVVGGVEIDDATVHAFVGSSTILLGVDFQETIELYVPKTGYPRRTLLSLEELLAFIDSQPESDQLREALLWQDEHNLKITDGKDWDAFIDAVTEAKVESVVDAFSRSVGNTRFTRGEADAWYALVHKRRNPDFAPHYIFVASGSVPRGPVDVDVAAQAARLASALAGVEKFALENQLENWAQVFRASLDLLQREDVPRHKIVPLFDGTGMSPPALRLFIASIQSDVFGGMGSWNDIGFSGEPAYRAVSDALFRELNPSLQVAVNSARRA